MSGAPERSGTANWRADRNSEVSERLRARIVDAARACLKFTGHEKLRMEMVAREAQCSRATLYRYFTSKEEILLSIAQENYQQINAEVDEQIRNVADPRMKLAVGLARSMSIAHSADVTHQFTAEMLNRAMMSDSDGLKAVVAGRIGPIYRLAARRGWLRKGVSEEDAVDWIMLGSTGLMQVGWPVIGGRELNHDEQVRYLARFLFFPIFYMEDLLD
ncbi:MAG: TetR/AcrR family transcriptional regulator [Halioglobus sp.]|nr:TetR/AcrR family transcriptional regulator [Halioglobus sp.]